MTLNIQFIQINTFKFYITTLFWKHLRGTRLIAVPKGKNIQKVSNDKRTIRSQVPKPVIDQGMEKVQRLDGNGCEKSNQLQ